eukprot:CFRG1571T1
MMVESREMFNIDACESSRRRNSMEKPNRREVANNNERKRMIAINEGFTYLRKLVPGCMEEKPSKATILRKSGAYIESLHSRIHELEDMVSGDYIPTGKAPITRKIATPHINQGNTVTTMEMAPEENENTGDLTDYCDKPSHALRSPHTHVSKATNDLERSINELQNRMEEMKGMLVAARNTPLLTPLSSPMYGPESFASTYEGGPPRITSYDQMSEGHMRKDIENPSPRWQPYLPRRPQPSTSPNLNGVQNSRVSGSKGATPQSRADKSPSDVPSLRPLPPTALPSMGVADYHMSKGYQSPNSYSPPHQEKHHTFMPPLQTKLSQSQYQRQRHTQPSISHTNGQYSRQYYQSDHSEQRHSTGNVFHTLLSHPFSSSRHESSESRYVFANWRESACSSPEAACDEKAYVQSRDRYGDAESTNVNCHSRQSSDHGCYFRQHNSVPNESLGKSFPRSRHNTWISNDKDFGNMLKENSQMPTPPPPLPLQDITTSNKSNNLDTLCEAIHRIDSVDGVRYNNSDTYNNKVSNEKSTIPYTPNRQIPVNSYFNVKEQTYNVSPDSETADSNLAGQAGESSYS